MAVDSQQQTSVYKSIEVDAPQAVAWRVFTEQFRTWWPLSTHKIGRTPAVGAVIEPFAGGRWYEIGEDQSTCDWGKVLAWEPPNRLVLSWEISSRWQHDPALVTEVEIQFIAATPDRTRVELVHRHLERYGADLGKMRGLFASDGGWGGILSAFAARAAGSK